MRAQVKAFASATWSKSLSWPFMLIRPIDLLAQFTRLSQAVPAAGRAIISCCEIHTALSAGGGFVAAGSACVGSAGVGFAGAGSAAAGFAGGGGGVLDTLLLLPLPNRATTIPRMTRIIIPGPFRIL